MTVEAHEVGAWCRNKSDDLGDEIGRLKKLCKGAVRPFFQAFNEEASSAATAAIDPAKARIDRMKPLSP